MTKTKIFIAGATGYIGGLIVDHLLKHPGAHSFEITALVRSADKAEKLKSFGIIPAKLAGDAGVVFDSVNANDLGAAKTILHGIKKRYQAADKPPAFIHTWSGADLLADNAAGLYTTGKIWDDLDTHGLEMLPHTAPHRNVDLEIINADNEGYVRAYLVVPATVYGLPTGKLVSAGIANNRSIRIPQLIRAPLNRGRAGMVGKGLNSWGNVHNDDIGDLYITIYNAVSSGQHIGHGREGYYFGENGEHTLYDIGKGIGHVLVDLGMNTAVEPTTFVRKEIEKYFGESTLLGSNGRCRGNRPREIGWRPKGTPKNLFASIRPEVEEVLRRG